MEREVGRDVALLPKAHLHLHFTGSMRHATLLELAEAVIEVTGSKSEIVFEALPTDDPQVRQPDITLARQILGWEPQVSLREGLKRTIESAGAEALVGAG